jgi:hypothetical protein
MRRRRAAGERGGGRFADELRFCSSRYPSPFALIQVSHSAHTQLCLCSSPLCLHEKSSWAHANADDEADLQGGSSGKAEDQ